VNVIVNVPDGGVTVKLPEPVRPPAVMVASTLVAEL
jgi:hypothetical protein